MGIIPRVVESLTRRGGHGIRGGHKMIGCESIAPRRTTGETARSARYRKAKRKADNS